jgi:hypothetical protein
VRPSAGERLESLHERRIFTQAQHLFDVHGRLSAATIELF